MMSGLRMSDDQNRKINKLLDAKTVQKGHFMVTGDVAKAVKTGAVLLSILNSTYDLYLKTHHFHWNVEGSSFAELHNLLKTQYETLIEQVDSLAERVRAVGMKVDDRSVETDETGTDIDEEAMIRSLVSDYRSIAKQIKNGLEQKEIAEDQATTALLSEQLLSHEKAVWMLESSLKKAVMVKKRGSVKPKGNKIRKHPGHPDQSVHAGDAARRVRQVVGSTTPSGMARTGRAVGDRIDDKKVRAVISQLIRRFGSPIAAGTTGRRLGRKLRRELAPKVRQTLRSGTPTGIARLGQRLARGIKQSTRKSDVKKHLPGQHDQRTHTPKGRAAIARERATTQPSPVSEVPQEQPSFLDESSSSTQETSTHRLEREIVGAAGGAVAGSALRPALRTASRAIISWAPIAAALGGLTSRVGRLAGRLPSKRERKRLVRAMKKRARVLRKPLTQAAILGLRTLTKIKIPGAIGIGLIAAGTAYGYIQSRKPKAEKMVKQNETTPTRGDHVLAVFDSLGLLGVYLGNNKVRLVSKKSLIDVRTKPENILLVSQSSFVPDKDSKPEQLASLVENLNDETAKVEVIAERAEKMKDKTEKVSKHLPGQHDQRDHAPKSGGGVGPSQGAGTPGPTGPAPGVTRGVRPQRLRSLYSALNDINSVLDGVDAGSRLYSDLKDTATSISEQIKQLREKTPASPTTKVADSIEKGIGHSLEILTNAIRLISEQKPNEELSEEDEKKLGTIIREIEGLVGYIREVKEQGHFEKQETPGQQWRRTFRTTGVPKTERGRRAVHRIARRPQAAQAVHSAARGYERAKPAVRQFFSTPTGRRLREIGGVADAAGHYARQRLPKGKKPSFRAFTQTLGRAQQAVRGETARQFRSPKARQRARRDIKPVVQAFRQGAASARPIGRRKKIRRATRSGGMSGVTL